MFKILTIFFFDIISGKKHFKLFHSCSCYKSISLDKPHDFLLLDDGWNKFFQCCFFSCSWLILIYPDRLTITLYTNRGRGWFDHLPVVTIIRNTRCLLTLGYLAIKGRGKNRFVNIEMFVLISWATLPCTPALPLARSPSVHTGCSVIIVKNFQGVRVK